MPVDIPLHESQAVYPHRVKAAFTAQTLQMVLFCAGGGGGLALVCFFARFFHIMAEKPGFCHLCRAVFRCQKPDLNTRPQNLNFINKIAPAKRAKKHNKLVINSEV